MNNFNFLSTDNNFITFYLLTSFKLHVCMTLLNMLGCRNSFFCYQVSFFCDQVLERRNLLQPGLLKMNFNLREHKYKKADTPPPELTLKFFTSTRRINFDLRFTRHITKGLSLGTILSLSTFHKNQAV